MIARTKVSDRCLPAYSRGEEMMNMITHALGGLLGIAVLAMCVIRAVQNHNIYGIAASAVYGAAMICTFTVSSVYHGLQPGMGKKVMQILDHCTIYLLIAGTYTPVLFCGIRPVHPVTAWVLFGVVWGCAALGAVFTAIDLKKYGVFSKVCYIGMGWGIIFFLPQTIAAVGQRGFLLLLSGGIAYTVGAVLYGIGAKKHWIHSVFHIFVVLGSVLQFFAIYFYAIP